MTQRTDFAEVLTVSVGYSYTHLGELKRHTRRGGVVRVLDVRDGSDMWIVPDPPPGVVPDLTAERAVRERGRRMSHAARNRRKAAS